MFYLTIGSRFLAFSTQISTVLEGGVCLTRFFSLLRVLNVWQRKLGSLVERSIPVLTPADSKSAEYFLLMRFTLSRSPRLTHLSSVAYVTPILSARCCRSCFVAPAITRSFTVLMPESLSNPPHLGPIPLIVSMSRSISTGLFLIVIDGGSLFMRVSKSMGSGRGVEKSGGTGIVRRGSFLVRRAKPYGVAAISIQKNPSVIPFKRGA